MLGVSLRSLRSVVAIPTLPILCLFAAISSSLRPIPLRCALFLFALENQHLIPFGDLAQDPGCIPVC